MVSKNVLMTAAENAVCNSLRVKKSDKVCIITDEKTLRIGRTLFEVAAGYAKHVVLFVMEDFGKRPDDPEKALRLPQEIKDCFKESTVSIYAATGRPGEISTFRHPMLTLVRECNLRHGHMIGISDKIMSQGMLTPIAEIKKVTQKVYNIVRSCKTIRVTSPAGTDLTCTFSPTGKWIPELGIINPGKFYNLPCGEVFTAPESVDGTLVIDGPLGDSFKGYGLLKKTPVTITLKKGKIMGLDCKNKKLLKGLHAYIKTDKYASYIGEIGIGTNIGLKQVIGELLQDEKFPGVHMAWGDSYAHLTNIPRPSKVHCDGVVLKSNIWVDGRQIMKEGKYLIYGNGD